MKKKQLMALCLSGVLALSLAACGVPQSTEANTDTTVKAETETNETNPSRAADADSADKSSADADSADAASAEAASANAASANAASAVSESSETTAEVSTSLAQIDMTKWQYNADDDVYYQLGISYCATPADASYETLAVFVPGAYMTGTENGDGTYTCTLSEDGTVNGYTASTAPIVMPINTPGYSAQSPLSKYTSVKSYTDAGFVYVHAGCRGRDSGAPAGVTDLKAAIRYIRWCDELVAGDAESIFTFGMSGGGAQSAVVGSTGDSALYDAYLEEIGAVQGVSDAVLGSMCWCPITNLDSADAAYEWMMGSTRSDLSDEEQAISDALAEAFAKYINEAGIKDENGNVLTLEDSEDGIYQAGSYYEYLKSVIEQSLNNFLADTTFPYDASSSGGQGGPGRGGNGAGRRKGARPGFDGQDGTAGGEGAAVEAGGDGAAVEAGGDGAAVEAGGQEGATQDFGNGGEQDSAGGKQDFGSEGEQNWEETDQIARTGSGSGLSLSGTYETAQDYIAALNADGEWVSYDADTNTAEITSIDAFVKAFKTASKSLGAFDQLDEGQGENELFGYGDGSGAHFDATLAAILETLGNDAAADYAKDLSTTDSVGNTAETRLNMYTPLYYLLESSEGYGTSEVAQYWRIRTGITQSDTALSTEVNLALALENYQGVEDVDFETVWGAGHTQAERTGDSTTNFIEWVNACMK